MNPFIIQKPTFVTTDLVDHKNIFIKGVSVCAALVLAQQQGLQLVCFKLPTESESALCKIINYDKWRYYQNKNKKHQEKESHHKIKEIRFSPVIADHDIDYKVRHAEEFLEDNEEVVFIMQLKGRELLHFVEAEQKFNEIVLKCKNGKEVSRKKTENGIIVRLVKGKPKEIHDQHE